MIGAFFSFRNGDITRFALPHVAQHLDMTGDLFPGPFYARLLEIIDEELVSPPRTAARKGGPGRLPVLAKTYGEAWLSGEVDGEGGERYPG